MPLYQASAFFEANGHGWSETYFRDAGGETDLAALADFDRAKIWGKRAAALGKEGTIREQRVSFDNITGDSVLNYIDIAGNQAFSMDNPSTALLVRCGNTDNTKRKNVFLRGIDDDADIEGGKFNAGDAAFKNAVEAFFDALSTNNYGWKGIASTTVVPVSNYDTDIDGSGRIVFTVPNGAIADPGPGKYVRVRGKKMQLAAPSVLNTDLVLQWLTATTLRTVKPTATFPYPGVGPVFVVKTKDIVVIKNKRLQKITTRKTGKASYISRGRLPVRPRG